MSVVTPPPSHVRAAQGTILASASPRRRLLLDAIGARFTVLPADVDETPARGESPEAMTERLARAKAGRIARAHEDRLVIAADTAVVLGGTMLGKPRDEAENRRFLRDLSGTPHRVVGGHCLRLGDREETTVVVTHVTLRTLSDGEIDRFVSRGAGLDKAGGYAIQDVGAALVGEIRGCYTNVIGMSLPAVSAAAERLGVALV